jgi:class 3 adenylate cyclase
MVKFASECMTRMNQLTHELVETLGEDTANLEMRVGLHSGATTAGVLRGAKGRFQLFGDTVNTGRSRISVTVLNRGMYALSPSVYLAYVSASRMESNGVKGRIHVSQATADALIAKGKASWLTEREDKIIAKGKGEMTTYFVEMNSNDAKTSYSSDNPINVGRASATDADAEDGDGEA